MYKSKTNLEDIDLLLYVFMTCFGWAAGENHSPLKNLWLLMPNGNYVKKESERDASNANHFFSFRSSAIVVLVNLHL